MRTTLALIALAIGPLLVAPVLAQEPGLRLAQGSLGQPAPGPQMSAPDVIRALEAQGYHDFRKVERKHGIYEVTALNQGRVFKLYVDGATGRILGQQERLPKLDDDD